HVQAVHEDGTITPLATIGLQFDAFTELANRVDELAGEIALLQESAAQAQEGSNGFREFVGSNLLVTPLPSDLEQGSDFYLDSPEPGAPLEAFELPVSGWVIGRNLPVVAVDLVNPEGNRVQVP